MNTKWGTGFALAGLTLAVAAGGGALAVAIYRDGQRNQVEAAYRAQHPPKAGQSRYAVGGKLPVLMDFGADFCPPCRMMTPVLNDLQSHYAGKMIVRVIDVQATPEAGRQYGFQYIPTQIFQDAAGNELARHTGFLSKEDILAKWAELGYPMGE